MDRSAMMHVFEETLDPLSRTNLVDLPLLRSVCSRGIPNQPPWIRPRIWKLLLGTLPPEKDRWKQESSKARDSYYAIATKFLNELQEMPPPDYPLTPDDKLIDTISKDVDRTQPRIDFFRLPAEAFGACPLSPLPSDPSSEGPEGTGFPPRIDSSSALFNRLDAIQDTTRKGKSIGHTRPIASPLLAISPSLSTPEITLSADNTDDNPPPAPPSTKPTRPAVHVNVAPTTPLMTPTLSITSPTADISSSISLLTSHAIPTPVPKNSQILLRILYLYSVTHPHQPYTQGLNELLAPLYYALSSELDEGELAHAEADAFWLFSELMSELGTSVGSVENVKIAMSDLSLRLKWADIHLWEDLSRKSLDPELPFYSYRWLACLLSQDIPLSYLLPVWDTIFAQPPSTPDTNPRLSFLVNICTSMLIRIRAPLMKAGNVNSQSNGLWSDEYVDADAVPGQPDTGTMGQGFIDGMKLLQSYPLKAVGLTMIVEGAWDLHARQKAEEDARSRGPTVISSVSNRLRERIWSGITNQVEEEDEDDEETEEVEADETAPKVPSKDVIDQQVASETPSIETSTQAGALPKIRQYAEAFKASDAAASLAKASTNWRVAAQEALTPRHQRTPSQEVLPSIEENSAPTNGVAPAAKLRQYAEAFRSSDTAASLSKVSSNWTAAAISRWSAKPPVSSPLKPDTPLPEVTPAPVPNRTSSGFGKWSNIWGGVSTTLSPSLPQNTVADPPAVRDSRNSLPVPLHTSRQTDRSRSPAGSPSRRGSSPLRPSGYPVFGSPKSANYSPPPMPKHFADPRDSNVFDTRDSNIQALASPDDASLSESSNDDSGSRVGRSISSALATLTGGASGQPPSPPPALKTAPKPLLLGTSASRLSGTSGSPRTPSRDSRPSSLSSVGSPTSYQKAISPSIRNSTLPSVQDPMSPRSDSERSSIGVVPLRGVGVNRNSGSVPSASLMRKSRAAHVTGRSNLRDSRMSDDSLPGSPSSTVNSPVAPSTPPFLPVSNGANAVQVAVAGTQLQSAPHIRQEVEPIKKYSLSDKPVLAIQTSIEEPKLALGNSRADRARVRTKRTYASGSNIKVSETGVKTPRHKREPASEEGNSLHPLSTLVDEMEQFSDGPLTPRASIYDDSIKTPTSTGAASITSALPTKSTRSPSARSPRRSKRTTSKDDRAKSGIFSEEDGARADDEDGYGDLLSAYSEDDHAGSRRSIAGQ